MPSRPYLVFADVDETLINCKSMFDFLRYQLTARHGATGTSEYDRLRAGFQQAADAGTPRETINRAYYAAYEGESAASIAEWGERWFSDREPGGLFIEETREALRAHREAGAELILVSGSFSACLDPIARSVGAGHLLCTRPLVEEGGYTGRIETPMIGANKATAVQQFLAARPQIDPQDCYAYGDHPSDLPMLDCVGHPVAVGEDPALRACLDARLEAHPGARRPDTLLEPQR
ncbi:HAD family hydrolase [Streptomyces sp. H27-C3]|uniref:HAD family hydrolase n=1 Tax=Streptomyces sp. H27-C3 TaxID=3046305 RepID=UPI0024BA0857|nr:HAD family hydrolase [Streptomyces sp. H27-C3]MDJ0465890.1 HAD family hydrolase [Streptomyces sp. H27-C3]